MDLTDRQWQAIQPLMPPVHQGRGRPALDSRHILDGSFGRSAPILPGVSFPRITPLINPVIVSLGSGGLRGCMLRWSYFFIPI